MKPLGAAFAAITIAALWIACSGDAPSSCRPGEACSTERRCASADECPGPYNDRCGEGTCTDGVCGIKIFKEAASQRRGDCQVNKCDEESNEITVTDPGDIYDDGNPCWVYTCDGDQSVGQPRKEGPAPGGAGFCDGKKHLVDCLRTEDCADPLLICSFDKKCVPASCQNGVVDPSLGETGMDCGGPCDVCGIDSTCINDGDCITNVCGPGKTCIGGNCNDGRKTENETDVDCGSEPCDDCKDGQRCISAGDCESRVCWAGRCQAPTCFDDTKNGTETGRDCGGGCHPCRNAP